MSSGYTDYLLNAPTLLDAAAALAALQTAGIVATGDVPANMLGDPQTVTVNGTQLTIRARQGWAASTVTYSGVELPVSIPGAGIPGVWYLAIRTNTPPSVIPFDPSMFGFSITDPITSAAVLGGWE